MKIKNCIYGILIFSCWALLSCEEDKMPYLKLRDANVSFDLNTSRFNPSVLENASRLKVPVVLAGIPGTIPVSVSVEIDTVGHKNPAVEGVDYTIKEKTVTFPDGYGTQYIEVMPVNNEERQPNRTFDLVITSTTPELKPNPSNRITITIVDAGHPLLYMKGAYRVTALDRAFTGELVHFNVTIEPDPEDDEAVYVENVPLNVISQNTRFRMTVDAAAGVCYVPGQDLGSFTYQGISGTIGFYSSQIFTGDDGSSYVKVDPNKVMIFDYLDGGNRLKANDIIGAYVTSGDAEGNIFFVYENLVMERIGETIQAAESPSSFNSFSSGLRIPFRLE